MIFASKTPRDLNRDPLPSRNPYDGSRWRDDGGWGEMIHDPRPEFDHAQHSEPNPILLDFRHYANLVAADTRYPLSAPALAAHWTKSDLMWSEVILSVIDDEPLGTPSQEEHARRVLMRLARMEVAS